MAEIIPENEALEVAADLISGGGIAAVPTETVYGLAGDAANGVAVASIFEAKGRPNFNPLICHVSDITMAKKIGDISSLAAKIADAFWPGPLTIVVPLKPDAGIHPLVTAGLETIALRQPRGFLSELVSRLGRPVAAPSANRSGKITATSADAVASGLGDRIPMIVDGGPCPVGVESTIVKIEDDEVSVLRPGGISTAEIEAVIGKPVRRTQHPSGIEAPGMMTSHYAPGAKIRLNANSVHEGEALLGFGPERAADSDLAIAFANLSETGDLKEAAANLFALMTVLDRTGAVTIAVEPIPSEGLGEAINDRLQRAAAPRQQD